MTLAAPRPGLVICYAYLWENEHQSGAEEGRKNRPCAIVAARQVIEGRDVVTVVPVTHTQPERHNEFATGLAADPPWMKIGHRLAVIARSRFATRQSATARTVDQIAASQSGSSQ